MIHLLSFLHTLSTYANRWGGSRYRTEELAKFLNKHLYNIQEEQLKKGEKVNLRLAGDAFLGSHHTPLYAATIRKIDNTEHYYIYDELGFQAIFPKGTEILIHRNEEIKFEKIENLKEFDKRVINFESVPELKNDKIHHHLKFSDNFLTIKCKDVYDAQVLLCDGLSGLILLKAENDTKVKRVDQFNPRNIQEIYLIDIVEIFKIRAEAEEDIPSYEIEFLPFSYMLQKNRTLSDKSKHRYWRYRQKTLGKRWLEKMRSKVFRMKKDKMAFKMNLEHREK